MAAASDTKAEEYSTVRSAMGLLTSISGRNDLNGEWAFLGSWDSLDEAMKQTKYSKYACHELHLFLFFKDRAFFDGTVRPYLECKRAKGLIDHFVLGHDLKAYAEPGRFELLNALEKALLVGRVGGASGVQKDFTDRAEANPVSREEMDRVFNAALAGNALDDGKEDRLADQVSLVRNAEIEMMMPSAAAMPMSMDDMSYSRRMMSSAPSAPTAMA